MTDIRQELLEKAKAMGIKLTAQQADQFQTYMELLLEWNEKINLTAITQPEEVVEKHFLDSLTLLSWGKMKQGAKVIDVDAAISEVGIPLKIARPDIDLTLLDGTMKRLNFLGEVCTALKLSARRIHKRAEEAGLDKTMRERYDVATARAVAQPAGAGGVLHAPHQDEGVLHRHEGPRCGAGAGGRRQRSGHPGLRGAGSAPFDAARGRGAQPGDLPKAAVHTQRLPPSRRDNFETSLIRRKTYGA